MLKQKGARLPAAGQEKRLHGKQGSSFRIGERERGFDPGSKLEKRVPGAAEQVTARTGTQVACSHGSCSTP